MQNTSCLIRGCPNKGIHHGYCRRHYRQVKAALLLPQRLPRDRRALTVRISDGAKKRLEAAGEGTSYPSAYYAASRILEAMPRVEMAKYLKEGDKSK